MIENISLSKLLAHIEDFIDDESAGIMERAKGFTAQSGLDKVENLSDFDPQDPHLPMRLLERLSPFFDSGLLLQRGLSPESANWWITDVFWKGTAFHLDLKDQVRANHMVPEITPLQVHRAPAKKLLQHIKMDFLCPSAEADGFLLKPTPTCAYVLFSNMAAPWTIDHITHAHRLINKCFIY